MRESNTYDSSAILSQTFYVSIIMVPYNVVLVGAGGKMGCRLTDNLKSSQYQMHYLEVSDAGIERLADARNKNFVRK